MERGGWDGRLDGVTREEGEVDEGNGWGDTGRPEWALCPEGLSQHVVVMHDVGRFASESVCCLQLARDAAMWMMIS